MWGGQEGWLSGLEEAGFQRGLPTVWVAEGLLMYLEPGRVACLLREMAAASSPGTCLLLHSITQSLLHKSRSSLSQLLRSWCFGLRLLSRPFPLPCSCLHVARVLFPRHSSSLLSVSHLHEGVRALVAGLPRWAGPSTPGARAGTQQLGCSERRLREG